MSLVALGIVSAVAGMLGIAANRRNNDKNIKMQEKANLSNLSLARDEFDYQKYLNENQYQIMTKDAVKAGINPIAMSGGNVSSSSVSAGQVAAQSQAPDFSFISDIANLALQEKMNRDNNEVAKQIANINATASKYSADKSLEASKYSADKSYASSKYSADSSSTVASNQLAESVRQFNENFSEGQYQYNRTIENDVNKLKAQFYQSTGEIRAKLAEYYDAVKYGRPLGSLPQWFNDRALDLIDSLTDEDREAYVNRAYEHVKDSFFDVLNSTVRRPHSDTIDERYERSRASRSSH